MGTLSVAKVSSTVHYDRMTELRAIAGDAHEETLTERVARRLRGQLAERRIKKTDVIERTGWGKTTVYRKLKGETPLDTDQMETLWRLFDISPTFLMTGRSDQPGPGGDGGGSVRPKGFEPLTF